MNHLYPETDGHGAVFNSLLEAIMSSRNDVIDRQYGTFGVVKETLRFYFVSPRLNWDNPNPQQFGSVTVANINAGNFDGRYGQLLLDECVALAKAEALRDLTKMETSGSSLVGLTKLETKDVTSVKVPNFRKRSAAGEIFNNPFASSYRTFTCPEVDAGSTEWTIEYNTISKRFPYREIWYEGRINFVRTRSTLAAPQSLIDELDKHVRKDVSSQNAINTAFGNISQGEVELLTMLAEGKETVQHLASTVLRFARLVKSIKTGNFKELAPKTWKQWKQGDGVTKSMHTAGVFADAWMEARYAWTPLIMDAIGTLNLLTGNVSNRSTFRGNDGAQPFEDSFSKTLETGQGPITIDANIFGTQNAKAGVLCEAVFDSPNARQLGLFNIATMAKEVIPYSFVLEWFINLSGLLYYLNPNPLLRPRAAWATRAGYTHIVGNLSWTAPSGETVVTAFRYNTRWKDRNPVKEPSILTVDVNLDLKRLTDAVILSMRWLR